MASAQENPIILNIESSYGALLIGCFFSCVVWGITCLQVFWYFYHNDTDNMSRKAFVFFLWIVDTVNEILILKPMWPVLILQWGKVAGLSDIQNEMTHHVWVSGIVAVSVQFYYLHRVYTYSGKKWLAPVTLVRHCFSLAALSVFISSTQPFLANRLYSVIVESIPYQVIMYEKDVYFLVFIPLVYFCRHRNYTFAVLSTSSITALNISLRACSAVVDIFIAVSMSYYLIKRGIPQFSSTKKMYFRLFILTINTGAWTALFATIDFCLMAAYRNDLWYTMFEWPLCSLYLSVLLVNLNTREYVRGSVATKVWQGSAVQADTFGSGTNGSRTLEPRKDTFMMIGIETEQTLHVDKVDSRSDYKVGSSAVR
ncbi:hypothetical protein ACEPAG_3908 [Sanghuangporus baumii]